MDKYIKFPHKVVDSRLEAQQADNNDYNDNEYDNIINNNNNNKNNDNNNNNDDDNNEKQ